MIMNFRNEDLLWLLGLSLEIPETLEIQKIIWGKNISKSTYILIECEINYDNWDEDSPSYSYTLEYPNGEKEIVTITIEEIIEVCIIMRELKRSFNLLDVINYLISNKLKLVKIYE